MPATSIRQRRRVSLAAIVVAVGLLAGCAGQRAPSSYTGEVQKAFIEGCWTTLVSDHNSAGAKDGAVASADSLRSKYRDQVTSTKKECTCAFTKIKKDVPFGTFKKLDDKLIETPAKLPSSFTTAYDSCGVGDSLKSAG